MKLVPAEAGKIEKLVPRSRCWVEFLRSGTGIVSFKQVIGAGGTQLNDEDPKSNVRNLVQTTGSIHALVESTGSGGSVPYSNPNSWTIYKTSLGISCTMELAIVPVE